jgi:O-antigen/teichoic acid export membrane protein
MTPIVCRNTLAATAAAAVLAGAVSPFVVPALFGAAFDGAVLPFLWLLPGTVALSGTKVLAAYVFSRGRPMINAWIALATLIVTVTADLILIPSFEVSGAAAGASLGYVFSLGLTAYAFRRLSGQPLSDAILPRPGDIGFYRDGLRSLINRGAGQTLPDEGPARSNP